MGDQEEVRCVLLKFFNVSWLFLFTIVMIFIKTSKLKFDGITFVGRG